MASETYNGNQLLKRKGVQIQWEHDQVKEFIKCSSDPIYFAEKYIQIVHVDHGLIPMNLYDYQREIINQITHNRRAAVVTSRQAGKTTTAVAVILHFILFQEHKTVALLANKGDAAREILDRIKIAYEALPQWMQQGVVEWNKGSVQFEKFFPLLSSATSSSFLLFPSFSVLCLSSPSCVEPFSSFFDCDCPTISVY